MESKSKARQEKKKISSITYLAKRDSNEGEKRPHGAGLLSEGGKEQCGVSAICPILLKKTRGKRELKAFGLR